MINEAMMTQVAEKGGFIAGLDQSGGSTPGALRRYGIPDGSYTEDHLAFRNLDGFNGAKPPSESLCAALRGQREE